MSVNSSPIFFSSGCTIASFHVSTNTPSFKEVFINLVILGRTYGKMSFSRLVGITSNSQELEERLLMVDSTSFSVSVLNSLSVSTYHEFGLKRSSLSSCSLMFKILFMKKSVNLSASTWLFSSIGSGFSVTFPVRFPSSW